MKKKLTPVTKNNIPQKKEDLSEFTNTLKINQLNTEKEIEANFQALKKLKGTDQPFEQKNPESFEQLKTVIAPKHLKAISDVCQKFNYTVSIRLTGASSIKRIEQGAKPKPHSILEKSIKGGSIKKAYPNQDSNAIIDKVNKLDLDGFVGHWGPEGLKGVRITNPPENIEVRSGGLDHKNKEIFYVPIDLNHEKGGALLEQLKNSGEKWQKHLFTGDYDVLECYKANRQIMEATPEQVNFFTRLNRGIAKKDPGREGEFELNDKGLIDIKGNSEHAMFQHGDQATYTYSLLTKAKLTGSSVAKLVEPVAQDSDETVAWCKNGNWYVTNNIAQHDNIRNDFKITKPSTWNEIEYSKVRNGEKRTARYLGYANSKDELERKSIFDSKKVEGIFTKPINDYILPLAEDSKKSLKKNQLDTTLSKKNASKKPLKHKM